MTDVIDTHHEENGLGPSRQNLTQTMVYARGIVAGYAPIANMFGPEEFVPVAGKLSKARSEEHTSELQSRQYLVCRLLLEKKNHKQSSDLQNEYMLLRAM